MSDLENKKSILNSFIANIACIADEKYQERVWVRAEGQECDDIDDTICDFFDDGNNILENPKNHGVTQKQHELLIELQSKLRIFTDNSGVYWQEKSTVNLIKLPEWKEIINISQKVLKSFNL